MRAFVRSLAVVALVLLAGVPIAEAQECFIGQVRFMASNIVPSGHIAAEGQLLALPPPNTPPLELTPDQRRAQVLFALFGNRYGGSSAIAVALPDLRGRAPLGAGQSPGTSTRTLAETGGVESVTLGIAEMPAHSHVAVGTNDPAVDPDPEGNVWAGKGRTRLYGPPIAMGPMDVNALEPTGGGAPTDNMTPFVALRPTLCADGVFPQRPPQ